MSVGSSRAEERRSGISRLGLGFWKGRAREGGAMGREMRDASRVARFAKSAQRGGARTMGLRQLWTKSVSPYLSMVTPGTPSETPWNTLYAWSRRSGSEGAK